MLAQTPTPPYFAVIFSSLRTGSDEGLRQPGFLGLESARGQLGVSVSYWRDEGAVTAWKAEVRHAAAQRLGRERWYEAYRVRVARVEREYGFQR